MEMLAIYFALADNQGQIGNIAGRYKKQLVIDIRSDSKSSIEQLQGTSEVRDTVIRRICVAIRKLLEKMACIILFKHLERTRNIAGLLLDLRRRKEKEMLLIYQLQDDFKGSILGNPYLRDNLQKEFVFNSYLQYAG